MEFVQFKDYGDELGVRVVEGWAGTKGADFDMMRSFLTEEEAAAQDEAMEELEVYVVPETDNLEEKYLVLYPTAVSDEEGEQIKSAILSDFEMWNQGSESWADWADSYYSSDLQYHVNRHDRIQHNGQSINNRFIHIEDVGYQSQFPETLKLLGLSPESAHDTERQRQARTGQEYKMIKVLGGYNVRDLQSALISGQIRVFCRVPDL